MATLAEDLLTMVRIPSVTGSERALADFLDRRLREGPAALAYRLLRMGNSLVLEPRQRTERPLVVLAGHLDTVPEAGALSPRLRDGRIEGRGSADMKAGLAVMLALAEEPAGDSGFADLAFVFYSGEEGPAATNDLARVLSRQAWLGRASLAILLEPTLGKLELGCLGSLHLEVRFAGMACHSARPWLGRHPLSDALPWLERILRLPPRPVTLGGVEFREVVSLTTVRAGETRNVIPGTLVANLNLRYAPDRTSEEAETYARSLCPRWDGVEVEPVDHAVAGTIPIEAPVYRHLIESTGLPRRAKQAWTDVARFSELGVPALNWGPGDPNRAHVVEEWVEIERVERTHQSMRRFLWGAGPGR